MISGWAWVVRVGFWEEEEGWAQDGEHLFPETRGGIQVRASGPGVQGSGLDQQGLA